MPREITTHKVNGCNDAITIAAIDEPGSGGANHLYKITGFDSSSNQACPWVKLHGSPAVHSHVLFQNGPIPQVGTNGLTHEVLLAIVADRLECFQRGPFACNENQTALEAVRLAMAVLKSRTEKRVARGVEGTHQV